METFKLKIVSIVYLCNFAAMTIKDKLIESATSLFLKYGVKSVSMDDMARLLGISKKTIYSHVDNKKTLVSVVIETFIKKEHKDIKKISKKAGNAIEEMALIAKLVLKSLRIMKPKFTYDLKKYHPQTWKFVETVHFEFMKETIKSNVERGKKENLYRSDLDEYIISNFYFSIARLCIDEDVFNTEEIPVSTLFESFIRYHLNGIANDNGRKELSKQLKNIA